MLRVPTERGRSPSRRRGTGRLPRIAGDFAGEGGPVPTAMGPARHPETAGLGTAGIPVSRGFQPSAGREPCRIGATPESGEARRKPACGPHRRGIRPERRSDGGSSPNPGPRRRRSGVMRPALTVARRTLQDAFCRSDRPFRCHGACAGEPAPPLTILEAGARTECASSPVTTGCSEVVPAAWPLFAGRKAFCGRTPPP